MQFSALCKQYWRKNQLSKTTKLLCGKKVKFRVFRREFLWNHLLYWAQIFRDNWNCYAISIFKVFILLASPYSDAHMLMRQKVSTKIRLYRQRHDPLFKTRNDCLGNLDERHTYTYLGGLYNGNYTHLTCKIN